MSTSNAMSHAKYLAVGVAMWPIRPLLAVRSQEGISVAICPRIQPHIASNTEEIELIKLLQIESILYLPLS
jgi:hypothetical protein